MACDRSPMTFPMPPAIRSGRSIAWLGIVDGGRDIDDEFALRPFQM
jgi:hypothetical protein